MNEPLDSIELDQCKFCGKHFEVKRDWHVYCSVACRVKDWKKNNSPDDRIKNLEKEVAKIKEAMNK